MKIELTEDEIKMLLDICQGFKLTIENDRCSCPHDIMKKIENRIDMLINKLSEEKSEK